LTARLPSCWSGQIAGSALSAPTSSWQELVTARAAEDPEVSGWIRDGYLVDAANRLESDEGFTARLAPLLRRIRQGGAVPALVDRAAELPFSAFHHSRPRQGGLPPRCGAASGAAFAPSRSPSRRRW